MGPSVRRDMKALADHLINLGGEVLIAGCTEVPLVMNQDDIALPFIDSTERLAQAVVDIAYGARALP
jgi:aspartate racemase